MVREQSTKNIREGEKAWGVKSQILYLQIYTISFTYQSEGYHHHSHFNHRECISVYEDELNVLISARKRNEYSLSHAPHAPIETGSRGIISLELLK